MLGAEGHVGSLVPRSIHEGMVQLLRTISSNYPQEIRLTCCTRTLLSRCRRLKGKESWDVDVLVSCLSGTKEDSNIIPRSCFLAWDWEYKRHVMPSNLPVADDKLSLSTVLKCAWEASDYSLLVWKPEKNISAIVTSALVKILTLSVASKHRHTHC